MKIYKNRIITIKRLMNVERIINLYDSKKNKRILKRKKGLDKLIEKKAEIMEIRRELELDLFKISMDIKKIRKELSDFNNEKNKSKLYNDIKRAYLSKKLEKLHRKQHTLPEKEYFSRKLKKVIFYSINLFVTRKGRVTGNLYGPITDILGFIGSIGVNFLLPGFIGILLSGLAYKGISNLIYDKINKYSNKPEKRIEYYLPENKSNYSKLERKIEFKHEEEKNLENRVFQYDDLKETYNKMMYLKEIKIFEGNKINPN